MTKLKVGAVIGLVALALAVSACGRRGALEGPPGKEVYEPGTPRERVSQEKPDRPFILDGLL